MVSAKLFKLFMLLALFVTSCIAQAPVAAPTVSPVSAPTVSPTLAPPTSSPAPVLAHAPSLASPTPYPISRNPVVILVARFGWQRGLARVDLVILTSAKMTSLLPKVIGGDDDLVPLATLKLNASLASSTSMAIALTASSCEAVQVRISHCRSGQDLKALNLNLIRTSESEFESDAQMSESE
ncbi:hypothetical protein Tco_1042188 [Tanacetum coccineum]|uniref:Uncharacterized protein n=1 Tax=Tanacetum coccineum TaxID=301880 RepID=A0ABQ5GIB6_9ASTR